MKILCLCGKKFLRFNKYLKHVQMVKDIDKHKFEIIENGAEVRK